MKRRDPARRLLRVRIWAMLVAKQLGIAACAAAIALFLFVNIADEILERGTQGFDDAVANSFRQKASFATEQALMAVTWFGNGGTIFLAVVLSIALFLRNGRRIDAWSMAFTSLGGWLVLETLKVLFRRDRPETLLPTIGYSFPSGHSFLSLVIYGMLAYRLLHGVGRRRRVAGWLLAGGLILLVGSSRVLLGVHYPTDVIGGFCAGLFWLWGCLLVSHRFDEEARKDRRRRRLAMLARAGRKWVRPIRTHQRSTGNPGIS